MSVTYHFYPAAASLAEIRAARKRAYAAEADPIAMKMLRGEATEAEYKAKVEEIKSRFPYPEDM